MDPGRARVADITIVTILAVFILSAIALLKLDNCHVAGALRVALGSVVFIYLGHLMFEMKLLNLPQAANGQPPRNGGYYPSPQPSVSSVGGFSPLGSSVGRGLSSEAASGGGGASPLSEAGYMAPESGYMSGPSPSFSNDGSCSQRPSRTSVGRRSSSSSSEVISTSSCGSSTNLASDDQSAEKRRGQSLGRMEHPDAESDGEFTDLTCVSDERCTDLRTPPDDRSAETTKTTDTTSNVWWTDGLNTQGSGDDEEAESWITTDPWRQQAGGAMYHPNALLLNIVPQDGELTETMRQMDHLMAQEVRDEAPGQEWEDLLLLGIGRSPGWMRHYGTQH